MLHISKTIYDPLHGEVIDIGHLRPLVDSRPFQALAGKLQLGMTSLVYRNAHHTRFEHSIGAYRATQTRGHAWVRRGWITSEEHAAAAAYGLLHDVGHPAFSHVTEDFCALDDDQRSLELIEGELRKEIEACGINPDLVAEIARHDNPLYRMVHDKNLGTEKLDYLERDGFHTGQGRPSGIAYLRKFVMYPDRRLVIDEKAVEHVVDTLNFYMRMYKEIYFRKALVIAQRMFQKAVHHLIRADELNPADLYDMTDAELWGGHMYRSTEPVVRDMYARIRERRLFTEAVVFRSEEMLCETRVAGKAITCLSVSADEMSRLVTSPHLDKKNHEKLEAVEADIEDAVRLPAGSVLVVPVFNPERFRTKDVEVLGSNGEVHSLLERRPKTFEGMGELARSYEALRICTTPEHRETLSRAASDVKESVLSCI
ncbi:MAG TPA: hypothetical protein VGB97_02720 [Candidatus Paceibacterota bacterium]